MRRVVLARVAAIALIATVLLTACAPTYETPDDRSQARGAELGEAITLAMEKIDPAPGNLRVFANYDAAWVTMSTGDMTAPEVRNVIEQVLQTFSESRIASLPFRMEISHEQAGGGIASTPLDFWGYDPERAERYFTGMDVWLSVIADPDLQLDEEFRVQGGYVFATILVFDDRDLDAYRAEIVATLEAAGYVDPGVYVESGE